MCCSIIVDEVKYVAVTWLLCEQLFKKKISCFNEVFYANQVKLYSETVPIFCE